MCKGCLCPYINFFSTLALHKNKTITSSLKNRIYDKILFTCKQKWPGAVVRWTWLGEKWAWPKNFCMLACASVVFCLTPILYLFTPCRWCVPRFPAFLLIQHNRLQAYKSSVYHLCTHQQLHREEGTEWVEISGISRFYGLLQSTKIIDGFYSN